MLNKKFLSTVTVLYIEDDMTTLENIYSIFKPLFKKVIIAKNGFQGYQFCMKYKNEIDIIISDITMPELTGIDMLKKIRNAKMSIPIIFASAYQESQFLYEAIKLNISDYLIKPFNIQELLFKIESICHDLYQNKLIIRQKQELKQYLNLVDKVAIISKTDKKGRITFVNDIFCDVAGYSKEELIGQTHNIVRHPDMPKNAFQSLWRDIKEGKIWNGKVKNKAKNGSSYFVNATIMPIYDDLENISGYIGVRFLTTEDENEKREFKKKVMNTIQQNREKELSMMNQLEIMQQKLSKYKHAELMETALENEKKRSKKHYSQVCFYEEELKSQKKTFEEYRHENYQVRLDLNSRIENYKALKKILERKYKEQRIDIQSRDGEIMKLKERIEEQNKTILNLKDVISYRETQLIEAGERL